MFKVGDRVKHKFADPEVGEKTGTIIEIKFNEIHPPFTVFYDEKNDYLHDANLGEEYCGRCRWHNENELDLVIGIKEINWRCKDGK